MAWKDLEKLFLAQGGEFITPYPLLKGKARRIRTVLLDWDGVFNAGEKGEGATSLFSEADSMGLNMLRFGIYRKTGEMPYMAIVTGEENQTAFHLAQREHFNAVFFLVKNKAEVLSKVPGSQEEISFFYDDILDISLAREVGLRIMINRPASPLFSEMARQKQWCDYLTGQSGRDHGIREGCELILGLLHSYESTISERIDFSPGYQQYLEKRKKVKPQFFKAQQGKFTSFNPSK